ncbi:MAG: FtsW/RodA/SpoVE family cell cycle protein [Acidobacteria bacterium]|nr:FtsW/RodA/SpoVE family cell cycle protein [Acidobacteriota bacterium]MCA1651949.1 FtsW/RodA/SpoVE family cell cycle protein [Acidobacteriota bacterium]
MSVTYTTAAERDTLRLRQAARYRWPEPLLVVTSCVAVLAIVLACIGRLRAFDESEANVGGRVVNLNIVRDAHALEPVLGVAFANPSDRRSVAAELFRFVSGDGNDRREVPNVGAIAKATTSAGLPLFTPGDISKLKPFLSVRTREEFRRQVWLFGALYVLGFHAVAFLWQRRRVRTDLLLLAAAHLLTAIGFALLLSRPDPLRDSLLFVRYAETIALGLALMAALSFVDVAAMGFVSLSYLPLIAALSLSLLLILFGHGPGSSSAKVNLGPFQPIEGIRLLLALFLAGYFARRWELLREVRSEAIRDVRVPAWLNLPRVEYVLPVLVGVTAALMFFFFQKDLGPALFLCSVFLAVYAVARGRLGMALTGLVLLASGFYLGYRLQVSATLGDRVRMWQSPWDNAVAGGNQITHAVWAMATGGLFGTGLGLGDSRYLPAGHTDLILAAIGEELGAIGLMGVAGLFAVLAWRGFRIGRLAASDYGFFLATALTLFLILPVLIMASGVMGITPLTGVVTPFLSYGGSAMLANFAALGLLAAIHADSRPQNDFEPFRVPVRYLGGALGLCALVLVAVVVRVQVLAADDYIVKPHLGVQADGGRRFEYNPRVLDLIRQLPRGTIYDRRGLPIATEDARVLAGARRDYEALGISLATACPNPDDRCYPLGGKAFHVLGDVRTGSNWSATNTSYVERDADVRLRGFNDHAATVKTLDRAGQPMYTIHRDYRELVPVLRHRHEPKHPAVVSLRNRARDVRLTIDANLQLRVASIVATQAGKAQGKAAAVVLDPDTGAVLASASYPWPSSLDVPASETGDDADVWLDRARYGAYPPGSTFKLVVAMAALRAGLSGGRYVCARLPDGRIGATVRGWARPVRDDVLDKQPHGTIDMHDGLVHSCNAYFAQLAAHLGPEPLLDVADRLKISLSPKGNSARLVRQTLPQVGYGQAQVVASPLRMATVAAIAAADGLLHPPFVEQDARRPSRSEPIVDPPAARQLGRIMRDVVIGGTGRSLRNHAWPIAGKTGTAEVAGRASHGWFVGFAPAGPAPYRAKTRIAFAVVIEHAGYGGITAAPAAGEIVSAAAAAGLIGAPAAGALKE